MIKKIDKSKNMNLKTLTLAIPLLFLGSQALLDSWQQKKELHRMNFINI